MNIKATIGAVIALCASSMADGAFYGIPKNVRVYGSDKILISFSGSHGNNTCNSNSGAIVTGSADYVKDVLTVVLIARQEKIPVSGWSYTNSGSTGVFVAHAETGHDSPLGRG